MPDSPTLHCDRPKSVKIETTICIPICLIFNAAQEDEAAAKKAAPNAFCELVNLSA